MASSSRKGAPYGAPWSSLDLSVWNPLSRQRRLTVPGKAVLFRDPKEATFQSFGANRLLLPKSDQKRLFPMTGISHFLTLSGQNRLL